MPVTANLPYGLTPTVIVTFVKLLNKLAIYKLNAKKNAKNILNAKKTNINECLYFIESNINQEAIKNNPLLKGDKFLAHTQK